jgi:hypothetical protein
MNSAVIPDGVRWVKGEHHPSVRSFIVVRHHPNSVGEQRITGSSEDDPC